MSNTRHFYKLKIGTSLVYLVEYRSSSGLFNVTMSIFAILYVS